MGAGARDGRDGASRCDLPVLLARISRAVPHEGRRGNRLPLRARPLRDCLHKRQGPPMRRRRLQRWNGKGLPPPRGRPWHIRLRSGRPFLRQLLQNREAAIAQPGVVAFSTLEGPLLGLLASHSPLQGANHDGQCSEADDDDGERQEEAHTIATLHPGRRRRRHRRRGRRRERGRRRPKCRRKRRLRRLAPLGYGHRQMELLIPTCDFVSQRFQVHVRDVDLAAWGGDDTFRVCDPRRDLLAEPGSGI
mmetsp:Transcript_132649/g.383515  ORF Transcript_132649/g.383515 Transcript_132649/m.383515 type:complete len:248 (-) Transcript_132649:456-1199(-)